ncbi:SigE family RNA polymerase sigma factor [Actinoplanes bogorensis]|uniref:SigE family RNA polymerase sigma factor n=1 Tax=Paractinoplanes bogorensis TaxID=1610840 RepID=A0ABS5Z3N0_9ACTN|nr:SigE family RNA polymerase sigma factor [Actinoplanes bogorensis]MBU2670283.1 SigE family RNA polymerase sigma factor [Actinoplanes bogorensis]
MSFEDFVAGYGRSLVRLAFALSGDRQVAEDLAQTVLADVYRHWKRVRAAANPEAYVRRMLVNAHLSWRRRRWTTERPADLRPETGVPVADPAEAVAARDQMRMLLSRLAPRARTVLVLRYYADLDDAAIAAAMGVSESSVRATASRALASLRGPATIDAQRETR